MAPTSSAGRVEILNGVPIYFEVHGNGEPVLLLHGFSGCSQDWTGMLEMEALTAGGEFQLIIPDLRGHGRSFAPKSDHAATTKGAQPHSASSGQAGVGGPHEISPWRHDVATGDMIALLDHLGVQAIKGIGISGGGNVLLHMATRQPERVKAMVLVSATSYFPAQARPLMRAYADHLPAPERENLRQRHPGGDAQIDALLASTKAFADSYDDLNFTPPYLGRITARTLIVQGDRDPLYPVEISVEMAKAIPKSSLWIVPNAEHGPVLGERWTEFLKMATAFLRAEEKT
jgi:pimeloyl-ACP methyl ester carboxylesterase